MSTARFVFGMMIGAVLLLGTSFAGQSHLAPQQSLSQDRSPDGSKDSQTGGEKDQTGNYSNDNQKTLVEVKGGAREHRPVAVRAKPAPNHRPPSGRTPAVNDSRSEAGRNVPDSHPSSSTRSSNLSEKTFKHPSVPGPPPTVAIHGQQFRNSRLPGARMTTSGGAANSTRGTVINGTDIKPKP